MNESRIELAHDVAETSFVPKPRFRVFNLPKKIMFDDRLKTLSHNALKMYVFLAYKDYRKPAQTQVSLAEWEAAKNLGIPAIDLPGARQELKDAGLIDFKRRSKYDVSYLVAKDVSLHESISIFDDLSSVKIT